MSLCGQLLFRTNQELRKPGRVSHPSTSGPPSKPVLSLPEREGPCTVLSLPEQTRAMHCLLQVQTRAPPSQWMAGQDNLPPLLLCSFSIILQVWSLLMMQQEVQKSKSPSGTFSIGRILAS